MFLAFLANGGIMDDRDNNATTNVDELPARDNIAAAANGATNGAEANGATANGATANGDLAIDDTTGAIDATT